MSRWLRLHLYVGLVADQLAESVDRDGQVAERLGEIAAAPSDAESS